MYAFIHVLQWPAMAISLLGAWWLGDTERAHCHLGFAVLLVSNALWIVWATTDHAWALLTMQAAFVFLNGRGFYDSVKGKATE